MKTILFLTSCVDSGGVSKSLLNLLKVIDKNKYKIDLFVANSNGVFHSKIPQGINILSNSRLQKGWRRISLLVFLVNIVRFLLARIDRGLGGFILSKIYPEIETHYDVAVDYNGQSILYYMVDRINADVKLSFFHSDYEKWRYYERVDRRYYRFVDSIFTVSEQCVVAMGRVFPEFAEKIRLMENISIPALMEREAGEVVSDPLCDDSLSILTIGHVCESKGSSLAIKAAQILKSAGVSFRWYFLGTNSESRRYAKLAEDCGVKDEVVFMGVRTNPYPYLKQCGIFVLPSKFEGKSMALDEAKIFKKPIVVTNFSTVRDQFEDRVNASICEMLPNSLAKAILELATNKDLQVRYSESLSRMQKDNSSDLSKLYDAFEKRN